MMAAANCRLPPGAAEELPPRALVVLAGEDVVRGPRLKSSFFYAWPLTTSLYRGWCREVEVQGGAGAGVATFPIFPPTFTFSLVYIFYI